MTFPIPGVDASDFSTFELYKRDAAVNKGQHQLLRALDRVQYNVAHGAADTVIADELQLVQAAFATFKRARATDNAERDRSNGSRCQRFGAP